MTFCPKPLQSVGFDDPTRRVFIADNHADNSDCILLCYRTSSECLFQGWMGETFRFRCRRYAASLCSAEDAAQNQPQNDTIVTAEHGTADLREVGLIFAIGNAQDERVQAVLQVTHPLLKLSNPRFRHAILQFGNSQRRIHMTPSTAFAMTLVVPCPRNPLVHCTPANGPGGLQCLGSLQRLR